MILPEVYQGGGWFPSFSRFMEAFDPKWYRTYGCAPSTPEEVRETAVEFAPDIPALPEEYLDFLAHMGGRGLDLHHRAWLYHGGQLYLSGEEETCLTIGSYNLFDEGDSLAYCFPKEGQPYLVWRERWSDMAGGQVKVADSLGQLLCNQAFLAEGTEQFSFRHPPGPGLSPPPAALQALPGGGGVLQDPPGRGPQRGGALGHRLSAPDQEAVRAAGAAGL